MFLFLYAITTLISQPQTVLHQEMPYQRTVAFLDRPAVGKAQSDSDKLCYIAGQAYSPGYRYKWCSGVNDPVTGCHGYSCMTCKDDGHWTAPQAC